MSQVESFEALIVGGGKAGKTLAMDLARGGRRVALVERGMIGGTCVNVGCIPSKAVIRSAQVAHLAARAAQFGVRVDRWAADMPGVLANKRAVVAWAVGVNRDRLREALGDHLVLGEARFVAPRTVDVRPAGGGPGRRLTGEKLFINLGARPAMPDVPGLSDARPLTSETALELDRLPEHLLVVGGGYIGVELGQAFRRFGSRVTIVQRASHLLPTEDADVSEAVEAVLREDGIDVVLDAEAHAAEGRSGERVRLRVLAPRGERSIEASDVLVATGRAPMTRDVGLDAAGVDLDPRGFVLTGADAGTSSSYETSMPGIFAVGDVRSGSVKRVASAVGEGSVVVQAVHRYLQDAVPAVAPEPIVAGA